MVNLVKLLDNTKIKRNYVKIKVKETCKQRNALSRQFKKLIFSSKIFVKNKKYICTRIPAKVVHPNTISVKVVQTVVAMSP